jgi:hypothetical protein
MNKRYISGFFGVMMVLVCVIGMTGAVAALQPIQGTYDPMNPLEFVLACCQWELMKKIELSVLGMAPDERIYTPELAALDYIPPGWELGGSGAGLGQIGSSETKSYEATTSCCGQYEKALAQADMDIELVGARYQAWKASQAAAEAEQALAVNQTPDDEQILSSLSLEKNDTAEDEQILSLLNQEEDDADEDLDEATCAACAEAQMFAEWIFSQPKPIAE